MLYFKCFGNKSHIAHKNEKLSILYHNVMNNNLMKKNIKFMRQMMTVLNKFRRVKR